MISLKEHILKLISLTEEEVNHVLTYFSEVQVQKKEFLQEEGHPCKYNYFVVSGLIRMYFNDEKGKEKTLQFALENWWLTDYFSYRQKSNSEFYIQAVEKSTLASITFEKQEELLANHPKMERYFRIVHQTAHAAAQMRDKYHKDFSREEQFYHFASRFPEFVQRVPQYMLASYLGITPEYLSELRAKIIS